MITMVCIDTPIEIKCYRHACPPWRGGILPYVLRQLIATVSLPFDGLAKA